MPCTAPRPRPHAHPLRRPLLVAGAAVLLASCLLGCGPTTDRPGAGRSGDRGILTAVPDRPPEQITSRSLGAADGEVPDGTTVFADVAGVARLDPALLAELRAAADAAARDGVELEVNSGWRSHDYQAELFDAAVGTYGSRAEAARWVARPGTSVHEAGEAVDLGPTSAQEWLRAHGAGFGLCQVYLNEPWHYELRPDAPSRGCPSPYADPTDDPRMQR